MRPKAFLNVEDQECLEASESVHEHPNWAYDCIKYNPIQYSKRQKASESLRASDCIKFHPIRCPKHPRALESVRGHQKMSRVPNCIMYHCIGRVDQCIGWCLIQLDALICSRTLLDALSNQKASQSQRWAQRRTCSALFKRRFFFE